MDNQPVELIDQRVAARIRTRRIAMGITLQALAGQIGVAFQQAHKYERGLSRISAGRLYYVARALETPIGFFFAAEASDWQQAGDNAASGAAAKAKRASRVDDAA